MFLLQERISRVRADLPLEKQGGEGMASTHQKAAGSVGGWARSEARGGDYFRSDWGEQGDHE